MLYSRKNLLLRLGALALALPMAGFCTSVAVNGICVLGAACPDSDAIATSIGINGPPLSTSGALDFTVTLADNDEYHVTVSYSASYATSTFVSFNPIVTYVGNNGTTAASKGADTVSLDLYQNFYDPTGSSWDTIACEQFIAVVAAGGSASANLSYDGSSIGTLNAGSGTSFHSACTALTFNPVQNASPYLSSDYNVTFNFAAGTANGAFSSSPAPEPSAVDLCLFCGAPLLYLARRRRAAINVN